MNTDVEIIAVGDELLLGDVLDTNTHWLCQRISQIGGRVRRSATVPDRPEVIGEALRSALTRRPALVLVTGGLGPTRDDLTLASLATELERPLAVDPRALNMVQETYRDLAERGIVSDAAMTEARRKMAVLPRGAEPLRNQVGAAPGVLLGQDGTWIVCLPGVPSEMKDIFSSALSSHLGRLFGGRVFQERSLVTDCGDESVLAPIVDSLAVHHPLVYVKSRAKAYGKGVQLRITLSVAGEERHRASSAIDAAELDLAQALAGAGIAVLERSDIAPVGRTDC